GPSAGPSPPPDRRRTWPRGSPARREPTRSSWDRRPPSGSGSTSCSRASASAPSRTSRSRSTSTASSPPASTRRSYEENRMGPRSAPALPGRCRGLRGYGGSRRGPPSIRIGISSWADEALIEEGTFYPKRSMSAEARLRFYASVFDVVEVNSSYYAIPDVRNVRRWAERTPPSFVFHVKAWALMTGHHPRAQSLPADVARLVSPRARRTHRADV